VSDHQLAAWHGLSAAFLKLAPKIGRTTSAHVNAAPLKAEVQAVARLYMQEARPFLIKEGFEAELALLDGHFQKLFQLAAGRSSSAAYKSRVTAIRKALPAITSRLEMEVGSTAETAKMSSSEQVLFKAISDLVPSAGLSYQQAIHDLADATRVSFRGPATELREVLREVLDHQAPDDEVVASEGFGLEPGRGKPTMKQKVRFILKAREQGDTARELPEKAAEAVEAVIGGLARSVYNYGSLVTHVAGERLAVIQMKRYVEAVLSHLLEL
jgi:hypothetical protein